jgi:hypothetical protein
MPCRRRPGLTRLEVVVVLVIFLIGVGLFLSFIGRGREVSRRVECANHLKILGQAIYLYHGTQDKPGKGFLPPARIADGCATWPIPLGPYLSANNPFAEWNLQKSYAVQSAAVREVVLPLLLCPARNRKHGLSVAGDIGDLKAGLHLPGGLGDYACASGDGNPDFPWTGPEANGAIILGQVLEQKGDLILRWQSRTSFDSLKRLQSATILIGEKHVPLGEFGKAEFGDGSVLNGANPASFARIGGPGYGLAQSPSDPCNTNFGSSHPGFCHFLHADGSVQPYAISLEAEILGRLINRE